MKAGRFVNDSGGAAAPGLRRTGAFYVSGLHGIPANLRAGATMPLLW